MKLLRALLHETTESVEGSSTISKVLVKNGGGPTSLSPCIGCGVTFEDEEEDEDEDNPAVPANVTVSSSFITTPSISCLLGVIMSCGRKREKSDNIRRWGRKL